MSLELATILKLAPLASMQLKRYRRSRPSKTLDRRVLDEFENDTRLGPAVTESLQRQWLALHNDGRVAVILAGLLDGGDVVFLDALKQRFLELLSGLETLPLGVDDSTERIVQAVRNNFVAAQKDTDDAVQRGTSAVLSGQDVLEANFQSAFERIEGKIERPSARVIILASTFDEDLQRHVADLKLIDEAAAGRLAENLQSAGIDGVAATVAAPPAWAQHLPAAFWETSGRILADAGRLREAQAAFERQENTPGVTDRAEALMAAARAAEADKRPDDGDALLARANAINPEHPAVALFLASRAPAPEQRLALANAVEPVTDKQVARKENVRAIALLGLGRYDEAQAAARASCVANPSGGGRELASLGVILAAREKLPNRDRDDRPVVDAVQYQWSLYEDLKGKHRPAMAGVAGARAALGYAALGDTTAAADAIGAVFALDAALDEPEARSTLLAAAMAIGDGERAKSLADGIEDPLERRLAIAAAALMAGDSPSDVAAQLDELLAELPPGDDRSLALQLRLGAATEGSVDFDPALASELPEPARALAELEASRAMAAADYTRAAAAMAPFDDAAALAIRADIADRAGNASEAIGLQAALVRKHRTAPTMLRLAALRAQAGDYTGAIREALRLASDERKLQSARDAAYALAAQAASDAGDWEELEDMTERWGEFSPQRSDPKWGRTLALARQGRHQEGLEYARAVQLQPTTDGNRHLLFAQLYVLGIPDVRQRLQTLMELSDQFGRPKELEQAFIGAVLTAPSEDRGDDEEVVARFQDAMSTFEERFPDSGFLRAIAIDPDESPDELVEKLAAAQPKTTQEQADARQEFIDGVRLGRIPVAALAAMVGRGTAETILRNGAHPLAVFDDAMHEAELAAAQSALEQAAAAWDETACITVAELPEAHAQRIKAALPSSLIGQSVRDSLVQAARTRPGGDEVATMQVLPDGTVQIFEEDQELVARVREVEAAAARLAEELPAHPDARESDRPLAEILGHQDRPGPLAATASAIMAALDRDYVLYSDDRVMRGLARSMDVPAFGTVALIDAMQRRELIDADETLEMLNAVIDLAIWGLMLNPASYVDAARRVGFSLKRCVRPLLADELLLRHDKRLAHNALLLRAVAEEAAPELDAWAEAIMSSYRSLLELDPHVVASLLVAAQFDPNRHVTDNAERQRTMAIVEALRARDYVDREEPLHDPLLGALRRWLNAAPHAARDEILTNLLSHLPPESAEEARAQLEDDRGEGKNQEGAE